MSDSPQRLSKVSIGLISAFGLILAALVVDVAWSGVRAVGTAVSAARQDEKPGLTFPEFAGHPFTAELAMPRTECVLPDVSRDTEVLESYYENLARCMDQAWRPVLAAADLPATRPSVDVSDDPGETPCGRREADENFIAWYCTGDQTMYLPVGRMVEGNADSAVHHLFVVAHEFGHHVQELSGLLELSDARQASAPDEDAADEISRRTELQADCFAGLFLNAVAGNGSISRREAIYVVDTASTGASTHGSVRNQTRWATRGFRQGHTAACDTWAAPADEVSD